MRVNVYAQYNVFFYKLIKMYFYHITLFLLKALIKDEMFLITLALDFNAFLL